MSTRKIMEQVKDVLEQAIRDCVGAEGDMKVGKDLEGLCLFSRFLEHPLFGNTSIYITHYDHTCVDWNHEGATGEPSDKELLKDVRVACGWCDVMVRFHSYLGSPMPDDVRDIRETTWTYYRMLCISRAFGVNDNVKRIAKEYFDRKK